MISFTYQNLVKPILFQFDPETVHEWSLKRLRQNAGLLSLFSSSFQYQDPRLSQSIWGLNFQHPIGLAAGFDKNAVAVDLWHHLGFAFAEVGTVTPDPQPGNPKPRLFRYPKEQAIVNRMGFNNAGSLAMAEHLKQHANQSNQFITGISLGKQASTPIEDLSAVIHDYTNSLERLYPYGGFFVVNVSSPNTKNLRELQTAERLNQLLTAIIETMTAVSPQQQRKPLCVKLAPDLDNSIIGEAVTVAQSCGINGIIATNTTNQTGQRESGGLSGAPLRQRATEVIRLIAQTTQGTMPIIGVGGIITAEDAIEKLKAGAWLLQIYTGFVYQGPTINRTILRGIANYLDQNNLEQISQIRQLHTG